MITFICIYQNIFVSQSSSQLSHNNKNKSSDKDIRMDEASFEQHQSDEDNDNQQNYDHDEDSHDEGLNGDEVDVYQNYYEDYNDYEEENYKQQNLLNQKLQQALREFINIQNRKKSLNEEDKKYLRKIKEEASEKYYKQQFKFNRQVKDLYPLKFYLNVREIFENLKAQFAETGGYNLCQVSIKTYKKDEEKAQKKYQAKIDRIERQISNILKKYCYEENVDNEKKQKIVLIQKGLPQFIHFTLKLSIHRKVEAEELQNIAWKPSDFGKQATITKDRDKNQYYLNVSNHSYCNTLDSWDIGCRVKSQDKQIFYSYFNPQGQCYITFSQSMMQRQEQSNIREICIYISLESNIVLRAIIKKQQIYLLSYSQNSQDCYFFLSSPPSYQFSVPPQNTYCQPNYLNQWEKVENFLLLKHRFFKDNDFLRLFLYSNSYIHIKLNKNDQQSHRNIRTDIKFIQRELNCMNQPLSNLNIEFSKRFPSILNVLDADYLSSTLSFIHIPQKPFLTSHLKWKLSYQIMLLIRFNVISPENIPNFLRFVEINKDRLMQILECLSRRSAGYTNKVAGLNRFSSKVYQHLKGKIYDFLTQNTQRENQQEKQSAQDNSCLIYKVNITPSGILPCPISYETKCRLIRHYETRTDFFLKVTLLDDAGQNMKNQKYIYNKIMRKFLDSVNLLGKKYVPLGWSGSQLRASSLWYVNQIYKDEGELKQMTQNSILDFLGDFSKITVAAKKAARIGQALSSSYPYNSQYVKISITEDDKSLKNFLFTDGIGMISKELFTQIQDDFKKRNISFECCLQIRYKGAKGVLLVNQFLQGKTIVLRQSMIKYECDDPAAKKYLDILSWDKYLPGYLNRQIIILLKSLSISDETFLEFQRRYIQDLNNLDLNELDGNLLRIFNDTDESQDSICLTIKSLKGYDIAQDMFFQQFLETIKDNKILELKKKSRILIQKSARLIGVIDDYEILKEGEVFCSIKKSNKNQDVEVIKGPVILTRNPSLSPADVRKCRCLSLQEIQRRMLMNGYPQNYYTNFINCIVFPKKGLIPLTAQISGSDLDGDTFFICWDQKFIMREQQPCETLDDPNKKSPIQIGRPGFKEMLDFFVDFANNQKLGRINNIHTVIADQQEMFANHPNCRRLAAIHGKAVDYAKSGQAPQEIPRQLLIRDYPDFMEKWNKPSYKSRSILGKLYRDCKQEIQRRKQSKKKLQLKFQQKLVKELQISSITTKQISEIMDQLKKFQKDITHLLSQANVTSEFELYTGTSNDNDDFKNDFGRKRLIDLLQALRNMHQNIFFKHRRSEFEKYRLLKNNKARKNNVFSKSILQKAVLAYLISYLCYYTSTEGQTIIGRLPNHLKPLCAKITTVQNAQNYHGKYLGFIWIIIPKIIVSITSAKKQTENN